MPRTQAVAVENNFTKGLITETTALKFPTDACTETFDCEFDFSGRVTRRLGIDFEEDYVLFSTAGQTTDIAFTEFSWNAVAGQGSMNFTVQQYGLLLRFYDNSSSTNLSANRKSFTINLTSFLPSTSDRNPAIYQCAYAQGNGKLIVVNEACDPFFVEYSPTENNVTATAITLKYRDFDGLDDGLDLTTRPNSDVPTLKLNNPEHYYNLLNQGWHIADALAQWDTALTSLPSNADTVPLYRGSATDAFDQTRVTAQSPGNTPASKGHFILEVANVDRTAAMVAEGFTGATVNSNPVLIDPSLCTAPLHGIVNVPFNNISGFDSLFDGDTSKTAAECFTSLSSTNTAMIGKQWVIEGVQTQITKAIVYGSSNQGFISGSNPSITLELYGKNGAAPVTTTDGTLIGTTTFTDTADESAGRTVTSTDTITIWDHNWIRMTTAGSLTWELAQVQFFANDANISLERPSAVEFFAGRVWYSGIKANDLTSNIYFSQIVQNNDQYGKAYQLNDPTNETLFDLLPTDGGIVKIPEIGTVVKLFATQSSLLVFATNGVWVIGGSSGASFTATDYVVTKLSNIGTNSNLSFANIQGIPFWWAQGDIYTAQFDANYNSYKVTPVTSTTISSFISAVPEANRRYVKGVYNIDNLHAFWLFNSDPNLTDFYSYDRVLVLNTITQAFYPWTIGDGAPDVRGVTNVVVGDASASPVVKFTTTVDITSTEQYLTFSEFRQTSYKDWTDYAAFTGVPADEIDYTSYLISGYRLDGQGYKFFQPHYVFVYLEQEDNASCFMQAIFDFTSTSSTGKWSTSQQVYNSGLLDRNANHRRLKVRGKGKAMQLKFRSESGKPFTLIGWVIPETGNATL